MFRHHRYFDTGCNKQGDRTITEQEILDRLQHFSVEGCPVADGQPACSPRCGGGWPGTTIPTETMTRAVINQRIVPEKLGCLPLEERARAGLLFIQMLLSAV